MRDLRFFQGVGKREFILASLAAQRQPSEIWPPPSDELDTSAVATVRLDWGKWIIDCPFCPGAAMLDWEQPIHYCLSCYNAAVAHRWIAVVLPTDEERHGVEAWLEALPEEHQHWRPGDVFEAGPPPPVKHDPEMLLNLAHNAGIERDRQAEIARAHADALADERRHTLALIHWIERLQKEAEIRKALNVELQDQIDAFGQHGHEN